MKRKLLWFAVMFALGEVTYIFAHRGIQISIIFVMLICCVKKIPVLSTLEKIVLFFGFLLGSFNVYVTENRTIPESDNFYISGSAVFVDRVRGEQGWNYTIKFKDEIVQENGEFDIGEVMLYGIEEEFTLGEMCKVSGQLKLFEQATNPGGFDMRTYYRTNGINFYMVNAKVEESFGKQEQFFETIYYRYKQTLRDFRDILLDRMKSYISETYIGLYESIMLGEKRKLTPDIKALYRINGIAHILAISGLHVTLIGGMLYKLFRKIGFKFLLSGTISIGIILSYGIMTGSSNSTIRAVVMITVSIIGEILGENYDMLTGMALALIIMLMMNPYKIYDGGVILSFLAIVGVAFGKYISKKIFMTGKLKKIKKKKRHLYTLINSLIITSSVNLITLPVIVSLYYEFPLYSVIINLAVIPLMTPVVLLGVLSIMFSYIDISFAKFVIYPGEIILQFYEWLCNLMLKLPYSSVNIGAVSWLQIGLYYTYIIVIFALFQRKAQSKLRDFIYKNTTKWLDERRWRRCFACILIGVSVIFFCMFAMIHVRGQKEMVCFLDVGQGDGILIRTEKGTNIVIDGGSSSEKNLGEYVMMPALKYMSMANVDYWFVTHADEDHISGLQYILSMGKLSGIKIKNIVLSKYIYKDDVLQDLLELAYGNNVNIIYFDVGDKITDGDFLLSCCFPYEGFFGEDKNQSSMAISYESSGLKILFTGDMDTKACEAMLENNGGILAEKYDVLKVPHHGSKYSICEDLYSYVSGGYAIISSGKDNIYGHPHEETINMLKKEGCNVLMTKEEGAVFIVAPFQNNGFLVY